MYQDYNNIAEIYYVIFWSKVGYPANHAYIKYRQMQTHVHEGMSRLLTTLNCIFHMWSNKSRVSVNTY